MSTTFEDIFQISETQHLLSFVYWLIFYRFAANKSFLKKSWEAKGSTNLKNNVKNIQLMVYFQNFQCNKMASVAKQFD